MAQTTLFHLQSLNTFPFIFLSISRCSCGRRLWRIPSCTGQPTFSPLWCFNFKISPEIVYPFYHTHSHVRPHSFLFPSLLYELLDWAARKIPPVRMETETRFLQKSRMCGRGKERVEEILRVPSPVFLDVSFCVLFWEERDQHTGSKTPAR